MQIDSVEVYHVRMPLIYPWRTAYGEDAEIHSVLVKMISGDLHGWGETSPLNAPTYSPEWASGVFSLIRDFLAPMIVGKNIDTAEDLLRLLDCFKGNYFAKAGLETAWWVLYAKSLGKPLHKLIGGKSEPVSVGADFGVQDSIEILLKKIESAVEAGFPRVKLKFRRGWDLNMLEAVRDRFTDFPFHIDCNAAFTLKDIELFRKVDRFDLEMIEQPLCHWDLLDHAKLQKLISTPICLDESITCPKAAEQAIELGSCKYVNLKVGRVGGILNAKLIHDMCMDAGIPCWVGGMLESSVGQGLSIELATLPNIKYPSDVFASKTYYVEDLGSPEIVLCGKGKVDVSKVPGTPYEPKPDLLRKLTIESAVIKKV